MADLRVLDVSRGPRSMWINGRLRPAYEWCEMFGHDVSESPDVCARCGGTRLRGAASQPDEGPVAGDGQP